MAAGVLHHPEFGVYLGSCMGLGFWSKLDPVGQDAAITFPSEKEARKIAASWDNQIEDLQFKPLIADQGEYASEKCCVENGLPGWLPHSETQ